MKCILLAAGIGNRLEPITNSIPKPMINIAGKPILEYILEDLLKFGYDDFCIVLGHKSKQFIDYFENMKSKNFKIAFITQKELLGTGNAVYCAKEFVKNEKFLVYLCDTIIPNNLNIFLEEIKNLNDDAAILSSQKFFNDSLSVGNIVVNGSYIEEISEKSEKPKSNIAWAGLAFFKDNSIFEIIENMKPSDSNEYDLTEAMSLLLKQNKKIKNFTCNQFIDFGTPKGLLEGSKFILSKKANFLEQKSFLKTSFLDNCNSPIGNNTEIGPFVYLSNNCSIGDNSQIGPYVSIDKNCKIGNNTHLFNCIVLENSVIKNNESYSNMIINGDQILNDSC